MAEQTRGQKLGQQLLAAVRAFGLDAWDASFMRLGVYHANPKALAFYQRIGFEPVADTKFMTLAGMAYDALGENP